MKTKYNSALATVLGGCLFTSLFALAAPPVEAQCQQWNVSGKWKIRQGSFTLPVVLSQNGRTITGSAQQRDAILTESEELGGVVKFQQTGNLAGTVHGTIEGGEFDVQIDWARGGAGVYRGTIGKNGQIRGMTYDKRKPSSTATWHSSKSMKCADEEAAAPATSTAPPPANPTPPPVVKPIKSSGKAKPSAATPSLKVNPVHFSIPEGQSQTTITLTWDAGSDHPNAEVWMKVRPGGEEALLTAEARGTRSVTVKRGEMYSFILKDSDQVLARSAAF